MDLNGGNISDGYLSQVHSFCKSNFRVFPGDDNETGVHDFRSHIKGSTIPRAVLRSISCYGINNGKGLPVTMETSLLVEYTKSCCHNCVYTSGDHGIFTYQERCMSDRYIPGDSDTGMVLNPRSGLICSPNSGGVECPGYEEEK